MHPGSRTGLWLIVLTLGCTACAAAPAARWQSLDLTVEVTAWVTPEAPEAVTLSQAEAEAALPFPVTLPTWVPDGYQLQDTVETVLPAENWPYGEITLTWAAPDEAQLTLTLSTAPVTAAGLSRPNAQSITLHGQPAFLTPVGLASAPRAWTLAWEEAGRRYTLTGDASLGPDALQRVADSLVP